jgi:hypothetical protein
MTDGTNSGAPGGAAPAGGAPSGSGTSGDNTGGSFVRTRAAQMAQTMTPAPSDGAPAAADAWQQQNAPAGDRRMLEIDGNQYDENDVRSAIAEGAEAASRKATLPASPDAYEIKLPDDFVAPEGVRFEFNKNDPALKAARELAHKRGIDQATFSEMLGVYASTQMGSAIQNAQLRDANMKQLGVAGPQRAEAVATWLQARAGKDGQVMANWLRQYPAAHIVRAMEGVIRAFSNQGGVDYSQSHRAAQEEQAGRIAGYDNMSFAQRRAAQMQQQFGRGPQKSER